MRSSYEGEGITQLLIDWGKGDQAALEKLMPLVYSDLFMTRLPGHVMESSWRALAVLCFAMPFGD